MLTVQAGQNTTNKILITDQQGVVQDLSAATRFVLVLYGTDTANNVTVDTDVTAGTVTGNALGELTLNLGGVTLTEDVYTARLTVYDATNTNGVVYAHECCGPYLTVKVCGSFTAVTTGLYFEADVVNDDQASTFAFGVANTAEGPDPSQDVNKFEESGFWGIKGTITTDVTVIEDGTDNGTETVEFDEADVIRVALNSSGQLWIGVHSGGSTTWVGGGDPSTATTPTLSGITGTVRGYVGMNNGGS